MPRTTLRVGRTLALLTAAMALLALPVRGALAQAEPLMVGCSWAPDRLGGGPDPAAGSSQPSAGVDNGDDDENEPKIVGSMAAPANVKEDDQAALLPLAKISRDEAITIARGAVRDGDKRRVSEAELEAEQGYVVWEVELRLGRGESGPDRDVEVVVDAGTGQVLLVECENEDD